MREIIHLACAGAQVKKGRNTLQDVYIHGCVEQPPCSGQIETKLGKFVCLAKVIKHAKCHRYNLSGFGAVRF